MKKLKICVYAICKNESKYVNSWMKSMREADLVVVTDTGSTDDTVKKLKKRGAQVYIEIIEPWRFDVARNISLSHVPDDVDICVCTDLDETFLPGWRKKLETAWLNHSPKNKGGIAKTGRYLYNWSFKADGTPDVCFYYFKVHQRHGFVWKCPVHEYLHYTGGLPLEQVFIDGMVLNHYPDPEKSRGSYLPLLEMAVKETPNDPRMLYYLGREYMYKSRWQESIDTLKAYLKLPLAQWNEERCAAMRWIAVSCRNLGKNDDAYGWYFRAIAEAPYMREPYVEFSKMCYALKDWSMTYFLAEEALKIKEKSKTFVNMGYAWDYTPYDLCAISSYNLGLFDRSVEYTKQALKHSPQDKRLKENLKFLEGAVNV